jgi:hypothetical protein
MRHAWLCLLLLCAAVPLHAQKAFKVTYLTSASAYIDAGADDGLRVGDRVEVVKAGAVIAVLRVTDVASHRAACAIESTTAALTVGDAVRFTPAQSTGPVTAVPTAPGTGTDEAIAVERGESWARRNGLRGRIGVRYLGVFDQGGFGGDVSEPSADVRLDGNRVAGSSFDVQVDVRARHTVQTVADGREFDDNQARVYRLNSRWHSPSDHYQATLGRQFSSALASISTFDGVEVTYNRARWGAGVFGGTQPEPVDYGFSTDVAEAGVYARLRSLPGAGTRWEIVTAGIGSYQDGNINREYMAFLGRVMSPRVSLMLQQDIDVNRGWKKDAGESTVSFTNTFTSVRWRATSSVDLDAGYDNRRNIRLYRDFVSPETEFDDTWRQGVWGGAGVAFAQRYRLGGAARSSTGGSAGDATTYTITASAAHLTGAHLDVRLRSTRYENDASRGWMHTLGSGFAVGSRVRFDLFGGLREEQSKLFASSDASTSWFGADMDVDVGRSVYLSLTGEHNSGGDESYNQVYTGLSWRF